MSVIKKITKYIYIIRQPLCWSIGIFLLTFSLLYTGLYFLCRYKESFVIDVLQQTLDDETGLTWNVDGGLYPELSPFLGITLSNITVYEKNFLSSEQESFPMIKVKKLKVEPSLFSLLMGRLTLDSLVLINPEVVITQKSSTDTRGKDSLVVSDNVKSPSVLPSKSRTTTNSSIIITQDNTTEGSLPLHNNSTEASIKTESLAVSVSQAKRSEEEWQTELDSLTFVQKIIQSRDRERVGRIRIINGTFSMYNEKRELILSLQDITFSFFSSLGKKNTFVAKATMPSEDIFIDINASFVFPKDTKLSVLKGNIISNISLIPPQSREIRIGLSTSIDWCSLDNTISAPNLRIVSEGDIIQANVLFDGKHASAQGHLDVKALNLPRWFMFARNFPPGLQSPLLSLKGTGDFIVTKNSALAENLKLEFDKGLISGSVITKDFSHPVVDVDLDIKPYEDKPLDLDYIFPFLADYDKRVPDVEAPQFTMPFLVPYPSKGMDELPDVGYNVNIRLPKAIIHSLVGGPLSVHVFPIKGDITRILFSAPSLAGGSASGLIDFDTTLVLMHYDVKNINLSLLPENKRSSVLFAGRVTGGTDLSIKVKSGKWENSWGITFDAFAENLNISSPKEGWYLAAKKTNATGKGTVDTIKKNGIKLDGIWNANTQDVFTSWNPKGNDAIMSTLKGTIAWAPSGQKERGLHHIYGDLSAEGVLIAPLATQLVPVRGKLTSSFDWYINTGKVTLDAFNFNGWQSSIAGQLQIDSGKKPALITGDYKVKASPRVILKDWNLLPDAIKMPTVLTGTGTLTSQGDATYFDDLLLEMDSFPVSGNISTKTLGTAKSGTDDYRVLVKPNIVIEQIDFDKYLVPSTPEELIIKPATTLWNFSFMQGIDIEGKYLLKTSRFRRANFFDTNIEVNLKNKQLSVLSLTSDIYGGRGTLNLQGVLDPKKSQLDINKLLVVLKNISLSKAFQDLQGENSYAGIADMVFDIKGLMGCTADFPAALSGDWSIEIRDGLYPAFVGSETAGLRNTFTMASASGGMEKGRMKTDNFILSGSVVDMKGRGWVDLAQQKVDLGIMVDLAGIPTAPVSFKGSFDSMEMIVNGTRIAFGAVPVAGASVFYLFKGILELPARAIRGVGSLFESNKEITGRTYEPKNVAE